jgi:predicted nucleotide-binding protein
MANLPAASKEVAPGIQRRIVRLNMCIADLEAFEPRSVRERWSSEVIRLQRVIDETLSLELPAAAQRAYYGWAAKLDCGPQIGSKPLTLPETRNHLAIGKKKVLSLLRRSAQRLGEDAVTLGHRSSTDSEASRQRQVEIFVAYEHDGAGEGVARFIERLDFKAIIPDEQPNAGQTVIERFETAAKAVEFAVVLLAPGADPAVPQQVARRRRDVIFELGYLVGKLGRRRACLLHEGAMDLPSGLEGVIYTKMDQRGAWKMALARDLQAAGLSFDPRKLIGS